MRGDPIVETYDSQWLLLLGHKKYTLTKHLDPNDTCSFNIEIKSGILVPNSEGLTYPRFMDVEIYNLKLRFMQHGKVYVSFYFYSEKHFCKDFEMVKLSDYNTICVFHDVKLPCCRFLHC